MAQSAPKVCAARVWRQGFVSSDPVILPPLQLWHVKCISEGRSSTYLPGHGLARCFSRLWAGLFVLAPFSPTRYRSRMPKDAFTLSDVREPTLTIVCEPCGRRGRYNVERLVAKHGDTKLLYLLDTLTNCPKMQSANIYDRCKARFERRRSR